MRFDEPYIFVDTHGRVLDGRVIHLEETPSVIPWKLRMERYRNIALMAQKNWWMIYAMVLPCRASLEELGQAKAALSANLGAENLHPPAMWYREMSVAHKQLLPMVDRRLVLGSKENLVSYLPKLMESSPGRMFCGLHEMDGERIGYRSIAEVSLERMTMCIGSLFTEVIDLGGEPSHAWLKSAAIERGIKTITPIGEQENGVRHHVCAA